MILSVFDTLQRISTHLHSFYPNRTCQKYAQTFIKLHFIELRACRASQYTALRCTAYSIMQCFSLAYWCILHSVTVNSGAITPRIWLNVIVSCFLSQSKKIAQKALKTIWKLRDCLIVDEGLDEPMVINSRYLSIVLYKQENKKNETVIGEAKTKFVLPSYKGIFRSQAVEKAGITSKIVLFKGNPYTWHISAFKGKCHAIKLF